MANTRRRLAVKIPPSVISVNPTNNAVPINQTNLNPINPKPEPALPPPAPRMSEGYGLWYLPAANASAKQLTESKFHNAGFPPVVFASIKLIEEHFENDFSKWQSCTNYQDIINEFVSVPFKRLESEKPNSKVLKKYVNFINSLNVDLIEEAYHEKLKIIESKMKNCTLETLCDYSQDLVSHSNSLVFLHLCKHRLNSPAIIHLESLSEYISNLIEVAYNRFRI